MSRKLKRLLPPWIALLLALLAGCGGDESRDLSRVQVVRADGSAAAGAEVWFQASDVDWSQRQHERAELARLAATDLEAWLRRVGTMVLTDARGEASLATRVGGSAVVARLGAESATIWLSDRAHGDAHVLRLTESRRLSVRVVDTAGRPAPGVEVQIQEAGAPESAPWRPLGISDGRGTVQPHLGPGTAGSFRLGAFVPGAAPVVVEVDPRNAGSNRVELRVVRTGRLQLQLLGPDGRPARGEPGSSVQLSWADPSAPSGRRDWRGNISASGSVEHPAVAPGCSLVAEVEAGTTFRQVVAGPDAADTTRTVALRMPASTIILVGRVLNHLEQPLRGEMLRISLSAEGNERHLAATADTDGRVRVALPHGLEGQRPTVTVARSVNPSQRAVVVVEEPLGAGANPLGEVVIAPAPLLVSGRARWRDGSPVDRVPVEVQVRPRMRRASWTAAPALRPVHLGEGRFEVRGSVRSAVLRLVVQGEDHVPVAPVPFRPGKTDVEIVLDRGGTAAVTMRVDAATPWSDLRVSLAPEDAAAGLAPPRSDLGAVAEVVDESRVRVVFRGLATGRYRLAVLCPGHATPVQWIDGIPVRAGQPLVGPRLAEVDLRGRARAFDVTVVDAAGEPLVAPRCALLYRAAGGAGGNWFGASLTGRPVRVVAPAGVDILIAGPEHATVRRSAVDGPTALTLPRAPRLAVSIRPPPPELPPDYRLELDFEPASPTKLGREQELVELRSGQRMRLDQLLGRERLRIPLDHQGRGTMWARGLTEWTVALRVFRGQGLRRGRKTVTGSSPAAVDTRGSQDGRELWFEVTPEALDSAVRALGG